MVIITESQKQIILESTIDYKNSSNYKYKKIQRILEKLLNDNLEFDNTECSIIFECLAGYASSNFSLDEVENLRNLLKPYKFPEGNNTSKQ